MRVGGGYATFAGEEVSRALGLISLGEVDCGFETTWLLPNHADLDILMLACSTGGGYAAFSGRRWGLCH